MRSNVSVHFICIAPAYTSWSDFLIYFFLAGERPVITLYRITLQNVTVGYFTFESAIAGNTYFLFFQNFYVGHFGNGSNDLRVCG